MKVTMNVPHTVNKYFLKGINLLCQSITLLLYFLGSLLEYFQDQSLIGQQCLWNSAASQGQASEGCKGRQHEVVEIEGEEYGQAECWQDGQAHCSLTV